jgi:hypothetical protein
MFVFHICTKEMTTASSWRLESQGEIYVRAGTHTAGRVLTPWAR